ncbi:unnamed protein product [Discula destructiva]
MGSQVDSVGGDKVADFIEALQQAGYSGDVATPSSDAELYTELRERWSSRSEAQSPVIVAPSSERDIALVVRTAYQVGLDVGIRCGGHAAQRGAATETGVQIHLGKLRGTRLDKANKTIHVEGGCLWDNVFKALAGSGLIAVGGGVWMVGVGGYLTGGGYSWLSGKYGMACDQVVAARVVTGIGEVVECDAEHNADLFWGIRGGSSNFGIVTQFSLRLFDEPPEKTLTGALGFTPDRYAEVMNAVKTFYRRQTDSEAIVVTYTRPPPNREPAIVIMPWVQGTAEYHAKIMEPFTSLGPLFDATFVARTQVELSHGADSFFAAPGPSRHSGRSIQLNSFDFDYAETCWSEWLEFSSDPKWSATAVMFEDHHYTRLGNKVGGDNAWRKRDNHMYMIFDAVYDGAHNDAEADKWVQTQVKKANTAHATRHGTPGGLWVLGASASGHETPEELWGSNLPRMRALKAKYDPEGVFSSYFSIQGSKPLAKAFAKLNL